MEIRKKLAARLRQLMDSRPDLDTQTRVANAAGVGQSTIQRILTLEQSATVDLLEKIAHAFGMHPADLLLDSRVNIELMRAIDGLSQSEKDRIVGYVELATGLDMRQNGAAQLEFEKRSQVPEGLMAAKKRASARKPGADMGATKSSSHEPYTKNSQARKRSKH